MAKMLPSTACVLYGRLSSGLGLPCWSYVTSPKKKPTGCRVEAFSWDGDVFEVG